MNIAILETEHFEGAYPVIKLFDLPGNHLTIFTNENIFPKFRELLGSSIGQYSWLIKKTKRNCTNSFYV